MKKCILILTICLLAGLPAAACPNCKDSIPSSDAQAASALPGGFNASVYYMLGGFIAVLSGVVTMMVRTVREGTTHREPPTKH